MLRMCVGIQISFGMHFKLDNAADVNKLTDQITQFAPHLRPEF